MAYAVPFAAMSRVARFVVVLGCVGVAALAPLVAQAPATTRARPSGAAAGEAVPGLGTLSETQLRAYLTFIAHDALEGRETPSRGLDIAAGFLASLLTRWGLEPAGDNGSFFQSIALTRRLLDRTDTRLEVGR